jgi:hypothetical protein
MNMNPFDQFFQQKLDAVEVTPPPTAWNRIEANLVKKNKGLIWLRWAAVAGFLVSLTGMWWYAGSLPDAERVVAQQTPAANAPALAPEPAPITGTNEIQPEPTVTRVAKTTPMPVRVAATKPEPSASPTESPEVAAIAVPPTDAGVATSVEPTLPEATPVAEVAQAIEPVVVEYSLPPVILETTNEVVESTPETGLEKIRNTALDLKHSEGWWGNLRMAKDDLLALNFKKDKNKRLE